MSSREPFTPVAVGPGAAVRRMQPAWRWRSLLPALAAAALAAVPPALVVQDRWLQDPRAQLFFEKLPCQIGLLCGSPLPGYMLISLACIVGLAVFLGLRQAAVSAVLPEAPAPARAAGRPISAGQRVLGRRLWIMAGLGLLWVTVQAFTRPSPAGRSGWDMLAVLAAYGLGWGLYGNGLAALRAAWLRHRAWLPAAGLAHLALIVLLKAVYAAPSLLGLAVIFMAAAGLNLARHYRAVPKIYWVVSLALVLLSFNLNAWWLSVQGDEYEFFVSAQRLVQKSWLAAGDRLFDGTGAYSTHPMFSSIIQAAFMALLGVNNFGWRFGGLYLAALSLPFYYGFFRAFVAERYALLMALWLGSAYYLMTFGKIGYNNLQALFALGLVLWAGARAARGGGAVAFVGLGAALGLCFYVYPAALYVTPVPVLLLLLYAPPWAPGAARRWAALLLTVGLIIFPLLLQPDYWWSKAAGTLYNPALAGVKRDLGAEVASNFGYAALAPLYLIEETHFLTVSQVDPLSGGLAVLGVAAALAGARRQRFTVFLLLSWLGLLFLAGATHGRQYPPNTRMFLLLPWVGALAILGLAWLAEQIEAGGLGAVAGRGFVRVAMAAVVGLNLYQAYDLAYQRWAGVPVFEPLVLQLVQRSQPAAAAGLRPRTFVILTEPGWGIEGLRTLANVYRTDFEGVALDQVTLAAPLLTAADQARLTRLDTLVLVRPALSEQWPEALGSQLSALGLKVCAIATPLGQVRFQLWYRPEWEWLCHAVDGAA